MANTIFERIAAREIPARIVHEDELCLAIHDIQPQAPVHVILFPKRLIPRLAQAAPEDQALLGHLMLTVAAIARQLGLEQGFRVVINNGPDGGESVPHLHIHLLGRRALAWPPG